MDECYIDIFPEIRKIYDDLIDERSKLLFCHRLLFNLTNDFIYIQKIVSDIPLFKGVKPHPHLEFYIKCKEYVNQEKKLIFYGAASFPQSLYDFSINERYFNYAIFKELPWYCFCDGDEEKQKVLFLGHKVISPQQLINDHNNDIVVIGTWGRNEEIKRYLVGLGFPIENIIFYPEQPADADIVFLPEEQYFDREFMKPLTNEVFIDAGAFRCDTVEEFIKWCDGKYEKIYSFEPDEENYKLCNQIIKEKGINNIELNKIGLSDLNKTVFFTGDGSGGACIVDSSESLVEVVSLDSFLNGKGATFIKMDIEGSELKALKGASDTIKRYHPRLALSLYHKAEDIITIPSFIKSLDENYKFYLRHYSNFGIETVLYAVYLDETNEVE
ncbi:MAG TPA: FkbM family methyltransferase [Mobilitalea sp.]|nr:FkbM family methyltransferase [Mobilitalea sp.]